VPGWYELSRWDKEFVPLALNERHSSGDLIVPGAVPKSCFPGRCQRQ
jgi:hypothetical protein